jgi:hypothetical protein
MCRSAPLKRADRDVLTSSRARPSPIALPPKQRAHSCRRPRRPDVRRRHRGSVRRERRRSCSRRRSTPLPQIAIPRSTSPERSIWRGGLRSPDKSSVRLSEWAPNSKNSCPAPPDVAAISGFRANLPRSEAIPTRLVVFLGIAVVPQMQGDETPAPRLFSGHCRALRRRAREDRRERFALQAGAIPLSHCRSPAAARIARAWGALPLPGRRRQRRLETGLQCSSGLSIAGEIFCDPLGRAVERSAFSRRSMNGFMISIGMGKTTVEFCSAPISVRVWR